MSTEVAPVHPLVHVRLGRADTLANAANKLPTSFEPQALPTHAILRHGLDLYDAIVSPISNPCLPSFDKKNFL